MSPDLFNLYSEFILKELEEVEDGIQVNGRHINNIRYAVCFDRRERRTCSELNSSREYKP